MKKALSLLSLGLLTASLAFAHHAAEPLKPGEFAAYPYLALTGGSETGCNVVYRSDGSLSSVTVLPLTSEFETSFGGMPINLEYGISQSFSLGANIGVLTFVLDAVRDSRYPLYCSAYARYNFPGGGTPFSSFLVDEVFFSPLFDDGKSTMPGDGTINNFLTYSANYRVASLRGASLYAFCDFKNITTFSTRNDYSREKSYYESIQSQPVSFSSLPYSKLAICPGVEMQWKRLSFHVGFNFAVLKYCFILINGKPFYEVPNILEIGSPMSSLDFGWRLRW
jgi:hypothetical protein